MIVNIYWDKDPPTHLRRSEFGCQLLWLFIDIYPFSRVDFGLPSYFARYVS
jgi:hypothetical protein